MEILKHSIAITHNELRRESLPKLNRHVHLKELIGANEMHMTDL